MFPQQTAGLRHQVALPERRPLQPDLERRVPVGVEHRPQLRGRLAEPADGEHRAVGTDLRRPQVGRAAEPLVEGVLQLVQLHRLGR
jgi:hypothetical protein